MGYKDIINSFFLEMEFNMQFRWLYHFLLAACCSVSSLLYCYDPDQQAAEPIHEFLGKHLIASYSGCDRKALTDLPNLIKAMNNAVAASGATILSQNQHIFEPNGLTMVFLLSESHATIHTYPEYGACFVDLFTCGDKCSAEKFDTVLRAYLHPMKVSQRILIRHQDIEERG